MLKLFYIGHHNWVQDHDPVSIDRCGSMWYERGWVFQEHQLSRRKLIFGRYMLHFECGGLQISENGDISGLSGRDWSALATSNMSPKGIYSQFRSQVSRSFAGRNLTYESDRLPALSGIAKQVFNLTGDAYLAGIWKQDLDTGLLWRSGRDNGHNLAQHLDSFRKHTSTAPSWSWASRLGYFGQGMVGISMEYSQRHLRPEYRKIDGWTELQGAQLNPFGAAKNGTIQVTGKLMALPSDYGLVQQQAFAKDIWKVHRGGDVAAYCSLDYHLVEEAGNAGEAVMLLLSSSCRLVGKIPQFYLEDAEDKDSGTSGSNWDIEGNEETDEDQEGSGCVSEILSLHEDEEEDDEHDDGNEAEEEGQQSEDGDGKFEDNAEQAEEEDEEDEFDGVEADEENGGQEEVSQESVDSCALCNNPEHNREAWGLILHPADQSGQYYRVGIFLSRPHGAGGTYLFRNIEERRIDII